VEALLASAIAVVVTLAGGGALWFASTMSVHPDPAAVPSTPGGHVEQYSAAVEKGRRLARAMVLDGNLPGLSVAVGVDGDIVWTEGVGWADLAKGVPVTPETRFRIGTASTVLTSAAVGLLIEQGRLELDEHIQTYVPEFPKKEWPVTLRHVLGHTAGIRSDGGDESPLFSQRCERPADGLQFFADRELLFESGMQYRYSNYGWIVASAAVEAVAGEPFLTFMQERIFKPMGMDDTRAESATEEIPNRATFYFPRFEADPRYGQHLMRPLNLSCYAGSMVFLSTPSDLVRFGMAINSGTLLQASTVHLLQTSQRLTSGEETGYGLGWDLEAVTMAGKQTEVVGHDGKSLGGRVASLMTFRDREIVVAVVSNISYADTFSLATAIAEAFADAK
jgi:CubicO group peptidase (beta-lactamase class C family)